MDFRGTYTPLHAFREAYAKARAIGVGLSDSSSSDSEIEDLMPSPRTGLRRALTIESATEQRLESMDASLETQSMATGSSPRGTLSPRPPLSTGRQSSNKRVTAFSPKAFVPVRQTVAARFSSPVGQYRSPSQLKQARHSESALPVAGAADQGAEVNPERAHVALQGKTAEQGRHHGDVLQASSAVVHHGDAHNHQAEKGRDALLQASDAPHPSSTEGFSEAAPMPFRPAAVPFGQAAVPFKRVEPSPTAAAQRFRPAAVPFQTAEANTASSESADMIAQMDVAQSPALLGKPADSRTAGQLSDKVSPAFGRQLAFPRARRPILSAVKASVLSLQPVTTKVAVAGKTAELADGLVQQAGAVLPDELHAGPQEELVQKPAVAGSIMKAQIPKLNLVQVMPVAVSVTPPARSKQPAAAARTLSPSLTPPPPVPSFSPMLTPSPPALTAPSVVTADSPVGSLTATASRVKASVTPAKQASPSGRARSSSSSRKAHEPQSPEPVQQAAGKEASLAAAKVTEEAAEPTAVLQGRIPLLYKGLSQQQYAALQHQRATKGPRKALAFNYPSRFPWLPEKEQQAFEAAAAAASASTNQEAATPAAAHALPAPSERGGPLSPDKKGTGAQGQPSPLLTRPSKAQLAGSPSVQSPRAPWEIKASTAATTSPLAKRYAATPGIGSGSAARKDLDGQVSLTAALSKKAQQRRARKLAMHTPKGQGKSSWSRWLTAVLLMALCGGTAFMLAPPTTLPPPAASWQLALSGMAEQASSKLPPLVPRVQPHPSDQQHPSDASSWEQHITQGPLQVWHQAMSAVMSSLPTSLVPKRALEEGSEQVGSHWGQHAMAAPGDLWRQFMTSSQKLPEQLLTSAEPHRLSHHLSSMPKAAGALLRRTGLWLLEGLQSAGELAGLASEPAGQELDMPSLPVHGGSHEAVEASTVTEQRPSVEPTEVAYEAKPAWDHVIHDDTDTADLALEASLLEQDSQVDGTAGIHALSEGPELGATQDAVSEHAQPESDPADGSAEGQEADSAPGGSGVGVDGSAPEGSGLGADGSAPAGSGVGPDGGSPVRSGARTGGRARKSRLNRELAALGENTVVDTPHRARRFTVDSYDGRRGTISKFHRLNTLTQNVDTLDLRDGTILTPNDYEMAKAAENRELQSLRS
ncbi:hypothetical protein WJX82_003041 [Trebouxia sp. C0006]